MTRRPSAHHRSILLVKHGAGRGRSPDYMLPILRYLARSLSQDRIVLQVHQTGQPLPALDHLAAVVFWLADPLREHYPECHAEATSIAQRARRLGIRVVNPPDALSNTIKSVQARLWHQAGVPAAPCVPFATRDQLRDILQYSDYPLIIRPDQSHSQHGISYCQTREEADAVALGPCMLPGVVIRFIDTRAGYCSESAHSLWARFYHKKRAFVFGDRVQPNHIFFSRQPIVGLSSSTFFRFRGRRRILASLAAWQRWHSAALAADNAFWTGPPEAAQVMRRAAAALELDIVALDYSTFSDGRVILWEANPYFYLPPHWREGLMPHQRRLCKRIRGFYDCLAAMLVELVEPR